MNHRRSAIDFFQDLIVQLKKNKDALTFKFAKD